MDKLQSSGLLEQLEKCLSSAYESLTNQPKSKENLKLILSILGAFQPVDEVWTKKDKEQILRSKETPPRSPPKIKRITSPQDWAGRVLKTHRTSESIGEIKSISPLHQPKSSLSVLSCGLGEGLTPGDFNSGVGYSFAKKPRLPDRSSDSPGPADYSPSIAHVKSRSPNRSFSKKQRTTEIRNPEFSPGPVYNPQLRFVSK